MTVERRKPIHVLDAMSRIVEVVRQREIVEISLGESLNYFLAEDITATYDIPRFDKSPYDGFAIRSEDTIGASGENRIYFTVVDHIGAGVVSTVKIKKGEAIRIMTGAPIPEDADAIVMFEQTVETKDGFFVRKCFDVGENISKKGEECKDGDILLNHGQQINSGVIAVLATFGYQTVKVYKKPTIALIATGSELVDIGEPLKPGKIRNSNGPMIKALCELQSIACNTFKIQEDDFEGCLNVVEEALHCHDIVITTGGVSVGDYDYLPEVYKAINAKVLFNKVQMRPGSVTTVAYKNDKMLFGLSGNPSACYSGFHLFTKTAILSMMGSHSIYPVVVTAKLGEDIMKPNPFMRFIRSHISFNSDSMSVRPAGFNKSNAVVSIANSNSMIVLPSGSRGFMKGDSVKVMLTDHQSYERFLNL